MVRMWEYTDVSEPAVDESRVSTKHLNMGKRRI